MLRFPGFPVGLASRKYYIRCPLPDSIRLKVEEGDGSVKALTTGQGTRSFCTSCDFKFFLYYFINL